MKPRLIGALTHSQGRVLKSYGYELRRPSIRLGVALQTLSSWGVDEVVSLDISRKRGLSRDSLESVSATRVQLPLAYGGGIRTVADTELLHSIGVDRFVLESLIFENLDEVRRIRDHVGKQAMIASLPFDVFERKFWPLGNQDERVDPRELIQELVREELFSEFLIVDRFNEGQEGKFAITADWFSKILPEKSVIWFGGVAPGQVRDLARNKLTSGIAVGNPLFERESSLRPYRHEMANLA